MSSNVCALGPVDPTSIQNHEEEKSAPWIVRKLVESMTGRIVMSSYESLRAAGTSVICLSPWGDSSPLQLPCIRFRDIAVHTVVVATGGVAAVAAPVMGPVTEVAVSTFGDTVAVEMGLHAGFELTAKAADDLVFEQPLKHLLPIHSRRLETTATKTLSITLKFKTTIQDAALGFFRGSLHKDNSLFSSVKDYLDVEKGWFSPYLFASSRRPIIPRTMTPDVIFCHGPFLAGDYRIGETLLAESASTITFSSAPLPTAEEPALKHHKSLLPTHLPALTNLFGRSRTPSPEPTLTPLPSPPRPRRLVILVLGIKPHRKLWSTSHRPGESVIQYQLLNGCPAVVVPAKLGAPLVAWDALTLQTIWKLELPAEGEESENKPKSRFEGMVDVLFEFLDLCMDWERVEMEGKEMEPKEAVRDALELLLASAVRSGESKEVRKQIDKERSGIVIWRIP